MNDRSDPPRAGRQPVLRALPPKDVRHAIEYGWGVLATFSRRSAPLFLLTAACASLSPPAPSRSAFTVEEATIAGIQAALATGTLTCRTLVGEYLRRIAAYDRLGPELTSIVSINPRALAAADSLDAFMRRSGPAGPLHCVTVVVKDNIATTDMPTTAGVAALAGFTPRRDATVVRRLKDAGAIILAKGNLSEFAISFARTASSVLEGETRNPYALDYTPAGSSGGVAAAVAANFATVGLATETGKSIRGPAAYTALVGIRPTPGLTSTAGIAPIRAVTAAPLTRTVADLHAVLAVVAGPDPDDPTTSSASAGSSAGLHAPPTRTIGLRGLRIGVARQVDPTHKPDPEALSLFESAVGDLRSLGATIVDSIPFYDILNSRVGPAEPRDAALARFRQCSPLKFDLDDWLDRYGTPDLPRLGDIVAGGRFLAAFRPTYELALAVELPPSRNPICASGAYADTVRARVFRAMDLADVNAVAYPTWVTAPSRVAGPTFADTEMISLIAGTVGSPAITVPMGYLANGIPLGLELMARPREESLLLRIAAEYERRTRHRRPPPLGPPTLK